MPETPAAGRPGRLLPAAVGGAGSPCRGAVVALFAWLRELVTNPGRGRAEDVESVRQAVQAACPGDPAAQYTVLILNVLLDAPHPHERIVQHVQARWQDEALTAALLRGETGPLVEHRHLADLLSWCDASKARSTVAIELFAAVPATASHKPATRKPEPADAVTESDLLALMRDYRTWVGEPSYETMAARAEGQYVKSTLAQAARGDRLPNLQVFTAYMEGCGLHGHELEAWRDAWRSVKLSRPTGDGGK